MVIAPQVLVRNVLFDDRGAALLSTVQLLPALTDFAVYADPTAVLLDSGIHDLPRCQELAELHSRSLTLLRLAMLDGPADGNVLRLNGLPQLRSFALEGDHQYPPINLRIAAASFRGSPQLQSLQLLDVKELALQDGTLRQLTALTALRVTHCNLRSVPADLASVGKTLCVLDMSMNFGLQLSDSEVATILQCSRLERLGMSRQGEMDTETVGHLLKLLSAFRKQHGRDLDIFVDEDSYEECSGTDLRLVASSL